MAMNTKDLVELWKKRTSRLSKLSIVRLNVELFAERLSSGGRFLEQLREDVKNLSEWVQRETSDPDCLREITRYKRDLAVAKGILTEAEQLLADEPPQSMAQAADTPEFNELWDVAGQELNTMGVKIGNNVGKRVDKMVLHQLQRHWKDNSQERLDEFRSRIREQFDNRQ